MRILKFMGMIIPVGGVMGIKRLVINAPLGL